MCRVADPCGEPTIGFVRQILWVESRPRQVLMTWVGRPVAVSDWERRDAGAACNRNKVGEKQQRYLDVDERSAVEISRKM